MSSTIETLRRMANDIARNLEPIGGDNAALATADHIDKFWDPRMKQMIFADAKGSGRSILSPIAAAAIDHLAAGATRLVTVSLPTSMAVTRAREAHLSLWSLARDDSVLLVDGAA